MKLLTRLATAAALMMTTSCAMPDMNSAPGAYCIKTRDGREVMCNGKPLLQESTGYYRYRTFQDRDAMLRADEVLMIEEQGS